MAKRRAPAVTYPPGGQGVAALLPSLDMRHGGSAKGDGALAPVVESVWLCDKSAGRARDIR